MSKIRVWTRQHKNVLRELAETGRYLAKKEYIAMEMQEHTGLILTAYDWLVKNCPDAPNRPADVQYPVWLSFQEDTAMPAGGDGVVLELSIEESRITPVNIAKWGMILNFSYIPANENDAKRHRELLTLYRTDDARAVMTPFYPEIRREIMESWKRLFDDTVQVENDLKYGTIWEIRREWVTEVRGNV